MLAVSRRLRDVVITQPKPRSCSSTQSPAQLQLRECGEKFAWKRRKSGLLEAFERSESAESWLSFTLAETTTSCRPFHSSIGQRRFIDLSGARCIASGHWKETSAAPLKRHIGRSATRTAECRWDVRPVPSRVAVDHTRRINRCTARLLRVWPASSSHRDVTVDVGAAASQCRSMRFSDT